MDWADSIARSLQKGRGGDPMSQYPTRDSWAARVSELLHDANVVPDFDPNDWEDNPDPDAYVQKIIDAGDREPYDAWAERMFGPARPLRADGSVDRDFEDVVPGADPRDSEEERWLGRVQEILRQHGYDPDEIARGMNEMPGENSDAGLLIEYRLGSTDPDEAARNIMATFGEPGGGPGALTPDQLRAAINPPGPGGQVAFHPGTRGPGHLRSSNGYEIMLHQPTGQYLVYRQGQLVGRHQSIADAKAWVQQQ